LFIIGYLLAVSMLLAVGLCLLLSPGTYFALLDRMARVDLWAKPSSSWDPKAARWRVLGGAFTLIALLFIIGPPLSVHLRSPEGLHEQLRTSHPGTGVSWGGLVILLFFFALGLGLVTRPLAVLDRVSPRKLSVEPDVQRDAYKLRIFGGVLLVISLLGMWAGGTPLTR
jgi:hypothetical protein